MSNTIDWEYSSNLSLMSISSYVEYETGNINVPPTILFRNPVTSISKAYTTPHPTPLASVHVLNSLPVGVEQKQFRVDSGCNNRFEPGPRPCARMLLR